MKPSSFFTFGAAAIAACLGSARGQDLSVSTWAGSPGYASEVDGIGAAARFSSPYGIAVDAAGDAYVADHGGGVIRHIANGQVTTVGAHFFSPYGLAFDKSGNLYVTDTLNFVVDRVTPGGTVTVVAGMTGSRGTADGGAGVAQFSGPTGIAADASGNLYVADTNRDSGGAALRKIAADGTVTTVASGFVDLRGVAIDASGDIFVSDSGDNTIREVAADGTVSLYAGIPARTGADNGAALSSRFNEPSALAVDGGGNVFVADFGNSVIREITPDGVVSTVAGLAVVVGSTDGTGSAARFYTPAGIAIDAKGNVYISDTGNSTVRLATRAQAQATVSTAAATGSAAGTATSAATGGANLINLSVRAMVGQGSGDLVVGFVTSGSANKQVLVRGIGPTLASYGVADALAQPELTLYSGTGAEIADNAGWGGSAAMTQTMSNVGAFALTPNSADSALDETLTSGAYSAQVTGMNGTTGIALAEIYDVDGAAAASHLINVSSLAQVGSGSAGALVAGFVVGGSGNETVLVRGVGPTLANYGVSGALAAPQLTVYNGSGAVIASNAGWNNDATVASAAASVGAFSLPANSADAALVMTLPAGNYSAQIEGLNGSTGTALIEVYAVQ